MTVGGLNKADILHFFDQWSAQSEKSGELSKLERAEIQEAVRLAEKDGTITLDALHRAFDGKGFDRDLIPDFALELLRVSDGRSLVGDAKTFAEAARRLEAFCGRYYRNSDYVDADGTERYLSPHLETLFRERVLGLDYGQVPNVAGSHEGKTGHHLFAEGEQLVASKVVPNIAVDPHDFDRVYCVERDGQKYFVRGDANMSSYSAANLSTAELQKRHVDGFITWKADGPPLTGSEGMTNKAGHDDAGGINVELFVGDPTKGVDGARSLGVLSRNGLPGWATGTKLSLWLNQDHDFQQTELYDRIDSANRGWMRDFSIETLDVLDQTLAGLMGQQGLRVDEQLEGMRAQIAEARTWRQQRDADFVAREKAALEHLEGFSFGPGMFLRVTMHELHELASRLPGFRRHPKPLVGSAK